MDFNETASFPSAVSVSELNTFIKMLLESAPTLNDVYVKGEISNFKNHISSGHFYFSLKDKDSQIKAVMFRSSASKMKFVPENGMMVVAHGRVASYVRDGQYQLYADSMEPDGVGALYVAFEQLKQRLAAQGVFAPEKKKPLPKIPKTIGVITSPTGAAVRDIIKYSDKTLSVRKDCGISGTRPGRKCRIVADFRNTLFQRYRIGRCYYNRTRRWKHRGSMGFQR